jgi:hypothetical protein
MPANPDRTADDGRDAELFPICRSDQKTIGTTPSQSPWGLFPMGRSVAKVMLMTSMLRRASTNFGRRDPR